MSNDLLVTVEELCDASESLLENCSWFHREQKLADATKAVRAALAARQGAQPGREGERGAQS